MSSKKSLCWLPVAGNNDFLALGGNSNIFSLVDLDSNERDLFEESILLDFGNIPIHGANDFDYVVPDLDYFFPSKESEEKPKFKALLLTHYHDDHLKGVIDLLLRGRKVPPIIAPAMTFEMLDKYLADHNYKGSYSRIVAEPKKPIKLGKWTLEAFNVSHSTVGCIGYSIAAGGHRALHLGDFKVDQTVTLGPKTDLEYLKKLGDKQAVDFLVIDSVKSRQESNFFVNDRAMKSYIDSLITKHQNERVIMGIYGGYLELASMSMIAAAQQGRKIVIASQYMQDNIKAFEKSFGTLDVILSEKAGCDVKIYMDTDPAVQDLSPDETLILTDGNLRDEKSLLAAHLNGDKRPYANLESGDVVYLSKSILQGKQKLFAPAFDKLAQEGIKLFMADECLLAAHGHAPWRDIKHIIDLTKPKMIAPAYAMDFMIKEVFNKAADLSHKNGKIVCVTNGEMIEASPPTGKKVLQLLPYWIGVKYSLYRQKRTRRSLLGLRAKNPLKL